MTVVLDGSRVTGHGIVHKYTSENARVWEEVTDALTAEGYQGAALHAETLRRLEARHAGPYDTAESWNTMVTAGATLLWNLLIGAGGTAYTNAVAALGVGDSSTAFALGQTNLQGAVVTTDRIRKGMQATFPSVATNVLTAQSLFATTEANFTWNEWGFFNNVTDASGTMFNRAVANLGTKTSAVAWTLTVTLTAA